METEYLFPKLGNRMSPKEWEEAGRPGLLERARARKEDILAQAASQVPPEIDAAVRLAFNIHF
jgi:trimethylamine--corrinoid protein Co-methyltransferase